VAPSVLGIGYDARSSFMRGPASAPDEVRRVLHAGSANYTSERGVDVAPDRWNDLGNLDLGDIDALDARDQIMAAVSNATADGTPLLSIGGDHFVTYPIVAAMSQRYDNITIVHIDAHPDLYDELDGDRYSHACPFARIMEADHANRLVQFGIRTATQHQREQAERFGVEMHEVRSWDGTVPPLRGPVYISVDVDGLDPAYAPGVSHHEPGGLTMRQLLNIIHNVGDQGVQIIGADIVEINPARDIHDMTAMVGAKLVRELLGCMA